MRLLSALLLLTISICDMAFANRLDDTFVVRSVGEKEAVLEGTPKNLKAGDTLYFIRSPFQFKVASVKGEQVTIELPEKHDLQPSNALVRSLTSGIKKGIDTEDRLKKVLEE